MTCRKSFLIMLLYTLGSNKYSQLSLPSAISQTHIPTQIGTFTNKTISKVACGFYHTLLLINKMVFSYGQREMCALGRNGNNTEILKIEGLDDIIDISCGETHSAALQNNGDLYVWGCFYNSKRDHMFIPYYCFQHKPRLITKNVVKIASCDNCVIIQDKNGDIYYYGDLKYDNSYQKLTSSELKLNKFIGARDVYPIFDSIYASRSHFFGFKNDVIYAFGNELFGKLDDNRTYNLEQIDHDKILKIKTYKFKKMNSVIIQMTGNIIVEGYNHYSEIQYIIYNISGEKTIKYIDNIQILSCRNEAVIYVKDKQLFTWGENIYSKLGHLEKIIRKPTKLECDVGKIVGIYAGLEHTILLTDK